MSPREGKCPLDDYCTQEEGHEGGCGHVVHDRKAERLRMLAGEGVHDESKDCWCHPTVETYPNGDLVIHHAGSN